MKLDAQWLCRAPYRSWLMAIAREPRDAGAMRLFGSGPLPIHWTWRYLSEVQARQLWRAGSFGRSGLLP
jgi:hypothetical protein